MTSLTRILILFWIAYAIPASFAAEASLTDAEIKAILVDRIDTTNRGVGIVVGIIDEQGQRVVSHGSLNQDKKQPVDGETIFEIGSITKVFTTILLQDMVERGDMKLEDPVAKYLPKDVKVPSRNGKEITLLSLATLTSGLPRMPEPFLPKDPANPFPDYTTDKLYAFLSSYELMRNIGEKAEYSNVGMGLLGHAIALKAGQKYESIVLERIIQPLKMESTSITLNPAFISRLATGHNHACEAVPKWEWEDCCLVGAGALRSTAHDLLKFVSANLDLSPSKLTRVMQKTHEIRIRNIMPEVDIALGWHVNQKHGREIIWHNGGTYGHHCFLGFDKQQRRGVVVLSNSANSKDDIGLHLLESKYPLAKVKANVSQ